MSLFQYREFEIKDCYLLNERGKSSTALVLNNLALIDQRCYNYSYIGNRKVNVIFYYQLKQNAMFGNMICIL